MSHWADVALNRFPFGHEADLFAYNVFSISRTDLKRVHEGDVTRTRACNGAAPH